ncbi:MAG: hypothetical protein RIK87_06160 [Fuerstiella sp.]
MSKCDIRVTFDRPDRTYRGGATVSGEVHVLVNQDIRCNGIVLSHYWETHGRGNTTRGEKHETRLSEAVPLQEGEELHLPFEFTAPSWPLTYHGHYIYLDHYVHVAVDVPWAIDPKQQEEFILVAGERPEEFTGERSEIVKIETKATEATGAGRFILYGVLAILAVAFGAMFIFLIPILLLIGGAYWVWKKMIASRVGEVTLNIPHVIVGPGEPWPVELSFTPRKAFPVNGIMLKIFAEEAATSGSGTNSTTHRHTLYEQIHTLHPEGMLVSGERFSRQFQIDFPETTAWSLDKSDNKVLWSAELRIDIPRFPDWSRKTPLQVVPRQFLDEAAADSPDQRISGSTASSSTADAATFAIEQDAPPPMPDTGLDSGSAGEDMSPLLALLDEILQSGRFSNQRSEIAAAATGHTYDVAIVVDRASTTFGFPGHDDRYKNGRTVTGRLEGTGHEVQLFSVAASNDSIDAVRRGDTWQTLATVHSWDTLYDRLVLHEVPFD